jgi:hypothetical protein
MLWGRWALKNGSDPGGAYAIQPVMLADAAADKMLSAASRRKTVLSVAASSSVNGGTSRVFVLPGIEALAMTATAHAVRKSQCGPPRKYASGLSVRPPAVTIRFPFNASNEADPRMAGRLPQMPDRHSSFTRLRELHRHLFFAEIVAARAASGNDWGLPPAPYELAEPAAHRRKSRRGAQGEHHDTGIASMSKLKAEIGDRRHSKCRQG